MNHGYFVSSRDNELGFAVIAESEVEATAIAWDAELRDTCDEWWRKDVECLPLPNMNTTIRDMPKLQSPFVREKNETGDYVVTPVVEDGYEWVFTDPDVIAVEKLHGTNVSIYIQDGAITGVWNRTARVPIFNRGKEYIIDGVREAFSRKYTKFLPDGQHFGECIGPKINGNLYKLDKPMWVPFAKLQKDYAYRSWEQYPKTFEAINDWFKVLVPLFGRKHDSEFVEGIVFTHPDGRMAKLRRDMFDWFPERRH